MYAGNPEDERKSEIISDGGMLPDEETSANPEDTEGLYDEGILTDSDIVEVPLDATQDLEDDEFLESEGPTFVLDGERMTSREALWDEVLDVLPLPDYTGRNLDALADSLWELPPCAIVVRHAGLLMASGEPLRGYGQGLLDVLTEAASARSDDLNLAIER